MAITPQQMDRAIDVHFGFEAADDVAGVLSTLATDVEHDIVGFPTGPTVGRDAARGFYEAMFADLAGGRVTPLRRLYGDRFLVDESVWEGRAIGSPFGFEGLGRPLAFRLLHVIEFTHAGQIQREQEWVDLMAIKNQLATTA